MRNLHFRLASVTSEPLIVTMSLSFIQTIQGVIILSVPMHSDVELLPQVETTKAPTYPDFYLPDAMNPK